MLPIHFMQQQWYNLSDPAMEDALIQAPTILSIQHPLEQHDATSRSLGRRKSTSRPTAWL
jgi:IS5 family transposase